MYIDEKDYEQYCFVLPSGSKFGKNKNRFVREQLQKQHPCFSETCCVDCRYVFANGRLAARVVVMEKAVLARYRLEGKRSLSVKNPLTRRSEPVFAQMNLAPVFILAFLALAGPAAFFLHGKESTQDAGVIPDIPVSEAVAQESPPGVPPKSVAGFLPEICETLALNKGRVLSLSYQVTDETEHLFLAVSGLYPESLFGDSPPGAGVIFSDVTFTADKPVFSLEISASRSAFADNSAGDSSLTPKLRDAVREAKGFPVYEKTEGSEIGCVIPQDRLGEFFRLLEHLRLASGRRVQLLSAQEDQGERTVSISVKFGGSALPEDGEGFSFLPLEKQAVLFYEKPKPPPAIIPVAEKGAPQVVEPRIAESPQIFDSLKRVGVIREDGRIAAEFYRDSQGRIIRRNMP